MPRVGWALSRSPLASSSSASGGTYAPRIGSEAIRTRTEELSWLSAVAAGSLEGGKGHSKWQLGEGGRELGRIEGGREGGREGGDRARERKMRASTSKSRSDRNPDLVLPAAGFCFSFSSFAGSSLCVRSFVRSLARSLSRQGKYRHCVDEKTARRREAAAASP